MKTDSELLPVREIIEPDDVIGVAQVIQQARAEGMAIYPIGGGTALHFGLAPRQEGIGLSLAKLNQIIDYPARDMTITVQAGTKLQEISATLSQERQRLPFDVANAKLATVGGIVATNTNGPLQFSQGTVRDHVIGISAVDGTGMQFSGGGRVVKNVAGYDFCKLLTGSLGTLGVISQLTLKLKPAPTESTVVCCRPRDLEEAESLLAGLVHSRTTPAAIELLGGPAWHESPALDGLADAEKAHLLVVAFEGTAAEVPWMCEQLQSEWLAAGIDGIVELDSDTATALVDEWTEFPAGPAPLTVQFQVIPSHTTNVIAKALAIDSCCSFQAHAGNGVVIVQFPEFPAEGLAKTVVGELQPAAKRGLGSVIILSNPSGSELTHQSMWGGSDTPFGLMSAVKNRFDPDNILNPDRFVYT